MKKKTSVSGSVVETIKKIGGEHIGFIIHYGSTVTEYETSRSNVDIAVYYQGSEKHDLYELGKNNQMHDHGLNKLLALLNQ